MKKYMICTFNKDTHKFVCKEIYDVEMHGSITYEYIDSMGNVLWGIFSPEERCKHGVCTILSSFARYVHWYLNEGYLHE